MQAFERCITFPHVPRPLLSLFALSIHYPTFIPGTRLTQVRFDALVNTLDFL